MLRALLVVVVLLALAGAGWGATYTVTTNGDTGTGSLRWAIDQANSHAGGDRIEFDPGMMGRVIRPKSPLPTIAGNGTRILADINTDGAPDVTLNGMDAGSTSGLKITADDCVVVGLAVARFAGHGIALHSASGCTIRTCHVGVNLDGDHLGRNEGHQIWLYLSDNNTIGGAGPGGQNVIAAGWASPMRSGIYLRYSSGNCIRSSNIGIARDGETPLGTPQNSGVGITLDGMVRSALPSEGIAALATTGNSIGDPNAEQNVFGAMQTGIDLRNADNNHIKSNYLGLARDGSTHVPISGYCIRLANGSSGNEIGDTTQNPPAGNVISGGWVGLHFRDKGTTGNDVLNNLFGLNATGTRQRVLARDIECRNGAEQQFILGNVLCGKHMTTDTVGIIMDHAGSHTQINLNQFGLPVPTVGFVEVTPLDTAIRLRDTEATLYRNWFYGAKTGVLCYDTDPPSRMKRNTFDGCGTAVKLTGNAHAELGNLGSTKPYEGENRFLASNTWYIRNQTPNLIKAEGNSFPPRSVPHAKILDSHDNPSLGLVDIFPVGPALSSTGGTRALAVTASALATPRGAEVLFTLSAPAAATVSVRNLAGRPVRAICREKACQAGTNAVLWDAQSDQGLRVPSGTYLVEVSAAAEDGAQVRALTQVRLGR